MEKMDFRFTWFLSFAFFFCFIVLPGCTLSSLIRQSKHQQVSIQPKVLEVNGDNVLFDIKARVPKKMIRKKAAYGLEFHYQYGLDQSEAVGRITFKPGDFLYEDNMPTVNRQFSFPYSPKKNPGKLVMQGIASTPKGREKRTPFQELATGLVTTSKLIARNNRVELEPDTYRAKNTGHNVLTFYFDKGSSGLSSFFGSSVPVLKDFVEANIKTQSVEITGATSPEAEEFRNSRLGWQRALAVQKYYRHLLEIAGYTNSTKSVQFKTRALPKSWDMFLSRIQNSALPEAEIQQILTIINNPSTNAQKEAALKKLESADYLENYVYPMLRFVEVRIGYTPVPRKDYEIYLLSKKIVDHKVDKEVLTEEELRYAASLTPLLKEKQKIYEAAIAASDHWQAYHNLGVVYLQMARQEGRPAYKKALFQVATRNLTYASHRQPTARNFYHLASAHHLQGNLLEALQAYDYAIKLGGKAGALEFIFADKAALEIETGQLDDALNSLRYAGTSYQNYINKGLCYLLKENYEEAAKFYEAAARIKPQDGLAYYSQAVIAARRQDENQLSAHLQKAVRADKAFTQRAIEDQEFKPYLKKDSFQEALK
jgi:tetratricopeptide (TPR) repeat protein/outer membrane protein OmpA-like peptidoglycan-associated protein